MNYLHYFLPSVASPFSLIASSGIAQFDDIFTLILLIGCFLAFCAGWVIGLLSLQV